MSTQELQKVKGIGPKYAGLLYDAGITDLKTLAASTPEQLHDIIQAKGGLAHYDDWIQQARDFVSTQDKIHAELKDLVEELNDLAAQLKQIEPHFQPPPYTPQRMKTVLAENLDRFTPETIKSLRDNMPGASTLTDLKEMLKDTPPEEFLNPETWKGVWFVINYEVRDVASNLKKRILHTEDAEDDGEV